MVPLYIFIFGKMNLQGIPTRVILSVKGESMYELTELFLISVGIPGIFRIKSSISLSQCCSSTPCAVEEGKAMRLFVWTMIPKGCCAFAMGAISFSWI